MQGQLDLTEIKCILEKNIRDLMGASSNDDWRTKFPIYDADGVITGYEENMKGLQGFRDAIAQTILDVLTNIAGTGTPTTAQDGSGGSAGKSGDNSKIHLESSGDVELEGAKTNIQDGNFEVT